MPSRAIPVGVLGDSDSHSYQDSVTFTAPEQRGGPYRSTTLQWTEIWQRLRGDEVDLGAWNTWGTRGTIASAFRVLGLHARAPRKMDFRYNFAHTGSPCFALNEGMARQAEPLAELMSRDSVRWSNGVIVIRIGVNSFGQPEQLEAFAQGPLTDTILAPVRGCVEAVRRAVDTIRGANADTRIVLVGVLDNADWVKALDRWHDPAALSRISDALDVFDQGLRLIADADPAIAFHDDRAWWAAHWGGRSPTTGQPEYRPYSLGPAVAAITNTEGDHPRNLVLADGHFGTAGNALWLQSLVDLIEDTWGLGLTRIGLDEVLHITDPAGAFGMNVPGNGPASSPP